MNSGRNLILLFFTCCLFCPIVCRAEQTTAFQISLINPAQIFPQENSVDGFRLDLIYGVNNDVKGIDIGLVNEVKRDFNGVQLGLIGNITGRMVVGFQASVFYNDAQEELHGLQIGLVNHTGSLNGVQIGLINFNDDQRYKGFMPFINAAF